MTTRQGLRRFRALQPSSRFHDSFHPSEARFPKVVLEAKRKMARSEKDEKLGVCHTRFSGQIADAEFISLPDLMELVKQHIVVEEDISQFLEQFGARIRKDADLLSVHDLIPILSMYVAHDYLDIGVLNRISKEIVFDANRLSLKEIGIICHAFAHFRVSIPKMDRVLISRGESLAADSENLPGLLLVLAHHPSKTLTDMLAANTTGLRQEDVNEVILVCKKLGKKTPKNIFKFLEKVQISDVKLSAALLTLGVIRTDLVDKLILRAPDFLLTVPMNCSIEYIARRNEAAEIAASVLIAGLRTQDKPLEEAYSFLLTNSELLKGVRTHQLVALNSLRSSEQVMKEIKRKFNSLSTRQQKMIV